MSVNESSELAENYRTAAAVQDYSPQRWIDGVKIIDLRLFVDDGGSFNELIRVNAHGEIAGVDGFRVAQSSYSEVVPGAIKAWHLHRQQADLWFVPPSQRLLVGLLDTRTASATRDGTMRFVMGGGKTQLVYIPAGIAHGAANLWSATAAILYFVDRQFDPAAPDEWRLPWDHLGKEFWAIQHG
jgi:dTDP-4-dehydrorhamnose 3,5-epimerase